jgi:putative FmdB family regulatory protein
MPMFEYRCERCGAIAEVFQRTPSGRPACERCGSSETTRLVSLFSFRAAQKAKYSDDFRERSLPFLKGQAQQAFAEGKESEEATAYRLTERIGERIDRALVQHVFRKI